METKPCHRFWKRRGPLAPATAFAVTRQCLIIVTGMTLMAGCGNDARESAGAQLAQHRTTNSTTAEIAQTKGPEDGVKGLLSATLAPVKAIRTEETELKAREQLARLNLKFPDDFMRCVKNNDTLAVKLFLESGINTEQRDNVDGWTALQQAASKGNLKMVQLLLDHGADVLASKDGDDRWRAEEIARDRGHREVAEVLVSAKKRFRAALGLVPGTYFQVEDTFEGAKTNKWQFTEEGTFRSYWGKDGKPDALRFDGVYRLEGNTVILKFQLVASGERGNRQFAITASGLSDSYFQLVKSSENK